MGMSGDLIGGHTTSMDQTATHFLRQRDQFVSQAGQIQSAVQSLMSEWYGKSPQAYENVMRDWDRDLKRVLDDLEAISNQLHASSTSLTDLDSQLASQISGFGG